MKIKNCRRAFSRAPKKHRAGHRKGGDRPFFSFFGKKPPQTQNRPQKSGQFSGSFFGRFSKKFTKISKTFSFDFFCKIVLLRNFKFESPHFVVERHACATPLRGAGKIFRPFFSKRQKQRTNEQMVRLALFPRLSFLSRNFRASRNLQVAMCKMYARMC